MKITMIEKIVLGLILACIAVLCFTVPAMFKALDKCNPTIVSETKDGTTSSNIQCK